MVSYLSSQRLPVSMLKKDSCLPNSTLKTFNYNMMSAKRVLNSQSLNLNVYTHVERLHFVEVVTSDSDIDRGSNLPARRKDRFEH